MSIKIETKAKSRSSEIVMNGFFSTFSQKESYLFAEETLEFHGRYIYEIVDDGINRQPCR